MDVSIRRTGRVPIAGRATLYIAESSTRELRLIADQFGQRRMGAVVRVAVRRLTSAPSPDTQEVIRARRTHTTEMATVPVHLGDDLTAELDDLGKQIGCSRSELVRLACDQLLVQIAIGRMRGVPVDLSEEVDREVYRGTANRDMLIRRRRRAEARRRGQATG